MPVTESIFRIASDKVMGSIYTGQYRQARDLTLLINGVLTRDEKFIPAPRYIINLCTSKK